MHLTVRTARRLLPVLMLLPVFAFAQPAASQSSAPRRLRYDDLPTVAEYSIVRAWDHTNISYCFSNGTADIASSDENQAVLDAMALWSAVSPVTFAEVACASANITILWATGSHGDGAPFDGRNGVLAHAFYPPPNGSFAGDLHLDDAEDWTLSTRSDGAQPIDLVTVAAHELGHSLGLAHSDDQTALMYAFYGGSHRFLAQDDINGIQALYPGGGGTSTISIRDATITEPNSATKGLKFKVTLSAASAGSVSVSFATANGSAVAPGDYKTKSGTITFAAGQTSKLITVKVVGDTVVEPNETFVVNLSAPAGATIADGQATGTINNND
jgi:hypothetical protein